MSFRLKLSGLNREPTKNERGKAIIRSTELCCQNRFFAFSQLLCIFLAHGAPSTNFKSKKFYTFFVFCPNIFFFQGKSFRLRTKIHRQINLINILIQQRASQPNHTLYRKFYLNEFVANVLRDNIG